MAFATDSKSAWGDFSLKMRDKLSDVNDRDITREIVSDAANTLQTPPSPVPSATDFGNSPYVSPSEYLGGPAPTPTSPTAPPPTPTAAPAPTAPTAAPAPSQADELARIQQEALDIQGVLNGMSGGEETLGDAFNAPDTTTGPSYDDIYGEAVDEDAVYRNTLDQFQSQIDATNQAYDFLRDEAIMQGTGRLGSQRAMGARGGILGSDFAASQKNKVQQYNTAEQRQIAAERAAAIGGIENQARSLAEQRITGKRAARQQGAENYIDYLSREATLKQENTVKLAQALLAQGFTPDQMDDEEINRIAQAAGTTAADITTAFYGLQSEGAASSLETRKTEAEIAKLEADAQEGGRFRLSEGQAQYDAEGNLIAARGKTYKPDGSSNKVYSSKDIPGDVRADLIDDIQNEVTEEQLISLYPDVNLETIQEYYGQFAPLQEDAPWWNFWDDNEE